MNLEPLAVSVNDACLLLGIGRTLFYQMAADGRLGVLPLSLGGRKKLYGVEELRAYVRAGCPNREQWQCILECERNGKK